MAKTKRADEAGEPVAAPEVAAAATPEPDTIYIWCKPNGGDASFGPPEGVHAKEYRTRYATVPPPGARLISTPGGIRLSLGGRILTAAEVYGSATKPLDGWAVKGAPTGYRFDAMLGR